MNTMVYVEAAFFIGAIGVTVWTLFAGRPVSVDAKKLLIPVPTTWRTFDRRSVDRIERAI